MRELFPLAEPDGRRRPQTVAVLARDRPLEVVETPSGTLVSDWTVPRSGTSAAPGSRVPTDDGSSPEKVLDRRAYVGIGGQVGGEDSAAPGSEPARNPSQRRG
jgi:hypothetical protein